MAEDGRELAAALGPLGLWTGQFDGQQFAQVRSAVSALEGQGWPALWFIEALGREALTQAALLLDATERMIVATGIANVWGRDPMALAAARNTLAEAHSGRFVLGLGASHAPLVGMRGHEYRRPLARMREVLDGIDAAPVQGAIAGAEAPRVLAALGPRMLDLAAERAAGALTYLVTPEHTRTARSRLGSSPALCVEQAVTLTDDVEEARRIGRKHLEIYLGWPNYVNNWKRLGFTDDDVAGGGSDRLVDAMVVAGSVDRVAERVREHHDAGADHVCLQVLPMDASAMPEQEWADLASLLPRS
ncbi:LLM class F420-dependent oxidoreductase [Actinomycetospora cinnamomea]|uniref:Putative F420-dependent oxidoreductase n=1 Tax=Actinomycetospora cinnamomea TaxID=663609 RepID=A0A2U1EXD7_9PSEU|nr:LLM class F420-dependent oxidoreductase [Actinomycetospora cinnamomea]PVZ04571.1 putative F420-dependent oxidoreductase [Actinomycetospora cinnamomea]